MVRTLAVALLAMTSCGSVTPVSGEYTLLSFALASDTCGNDDPDVSDSEGDTFGVLHTPGTDTLTVGLDDDMVFDCTLQKATFVCASLEAREQASEGDATLSISWGMSGSFVSDTLIEPMDLVMSMACEGADCDRMLKGSEVTLPCETHLVATAELQSFDGS